MRRFFIVQLRTRGWAVGISFTPEERVLTSIFRLSRSQKNQLYALKVAFYRFLAKHSSFRLSDNYVVREDRLPIVVAEFDENVKPRFEELRRRIYEELSSQWHAISRRLADYLARSGRDAKVIERLRPNADAGLDGFLNMYLSIAPLDYYVAGVISLAEELEKAREKAKEYQRVIRAVREEALRRMEELRRSYEEKLREMENVVKKLKAERRREIYEMRLRGLMEDAQDIAELLGPETVEDLKARLEALKSFLGQ